MQYSEFAHYAQVNDDPCSMVGKKWYAEQNQRAAEQLCFDI